MNYESIPQREIKIRPIKVVKHELEDVVDETEIITSQLEQAKKELTQVENEKKLLLEETRTTIQLEKDNWATEKQQLFDEAKAEGYQAGFEEGKTESYKTYHETLEQANGIVDLVKVDYQKTLEKTEDIVIELAMHTAGKILEQKLDEQPDHFLDIVKAALKEINDQSVVSIYLHPEDFEAVLLQKEELKRILENDTKLSIYVNEKLEKNSCVIEHPFGQIDATINTQLENIRSALTELVMESKQ